MKLLFVCTENRLRSATGEEVFSQYEGITALGCGTNKDAVTPISGDLVEWADIIFAMEKSHKTKVRQKFNDLLKDKRLISLGIADNYKRMDPKLIQILKEKVSMHVDLNIGRK